MLPRARSRICPYGACLVTAGVLLTAACGGGGDSPSGPTTPSVVTLLDTSVNLPQGRGCNGTDDLGFNGQAGKTIVVTLTGTAGMDPHGNLYAPNYATLLASTIPPASTLTFTLTQTGTHVLAVCNRGPAGGTVRVNVVER